MKIAIIALALIVMPLANAQVYDGSKAMVTFKFDHAYLSQLPAIQNMTNLGMVGFIPIVTSKINTTAYLKDTDVLKLQSMGWEMAAHSNLHINEKLDNPTQLQTMQEVIGSGTALTYLYHLNILGYTSPDDAITPYSASLINSMYQHATIPACKINTLKTIANDGKNYYITIPALHTCGVSDYNSGQIHTLADYQKYLSQTVSTKGWIQLTFHQIDSDPSAFHTTPELFYQILNYTNYQVHKNNVAVVTPCGGLGLC